MTTLLYLHGVGDDGSRRDWVDRLGVTEPTIIAPNYLDLLNQPTSDSEDIGPPPTDPISQPPSRRAYQARQSQLHDQLQVLGSQSVWEESRRGFGRVPGLIDALGEQLVVQFLYEEVAAYAADARRRRAVRKRVLDAIAPKTPEVVIVGHSLGALVALDLLRHLPPGLRVRLLVTAASSLARRQIPSETLQLRDHFPYDHVAGWINVYNPQDPVTGGRPIGPRFPQAIDVRVTAGFGDHSLASCLADPGVARTLRSYLVAAPRATVSGPTEAAQTQPPSLVLDRGDALQLMLAQLLLRMGELYAADPDVKASDVARFQAATELVTENLSAIRDQAWIWDHSRTLRDGIAESDIPTLLVRLVDVQPLDYLRLRIPEDVDRKARIQVALDLGVPPLWLDLARSAQLRADAVVGSSRAKAKRAGVPLADGWRSWESEFERSLQQSLAEMSLNQDLPRLRDSVTDLAPIMVELVARALVANQIGTPAPGSEERAALSRMMVLLGKHRATLAELPDSPQALMTALKDNTRLIGDGLSWLGNQGIGIRPRARPL
ncbi:hypothetical protein N9D66_00055 [Candidatus Nanopelagicales bacterium]|nr:hypothetical protein [Candidatus Nanopelagicales bacterium]